ncbi:MAG: hypothetical protein QNK37_28485 [Acidobacteriota bacterium]|nr:hypothetical protein [Acidobacteriota bacterium]
MSDSIRQYDVPVWLDDTLHAVFRYKTAVDPGKHIRLDGQNQTVGNRRQGFLLIPEGRHRLVVEAPGELFARLEQPKQSRMLFPKLNGGETGTFQEEPADQTHKLPLPGSSDHGLIGRAAAQWGNPHERESSLAALATLQSRADALADPHLTRWVNELRLYLPYRTLLPYKSETPHTLVPLIGANEDTVWFTLPAQGEETRVSYRVDKLLFPVPARLLVDPADEAPVFLIQTGDGAEIPHQVVPREGKRFGRVDFHIPAGCTRLTIRQVNGVTTAPVCLQVAASGTFHLQQPEFNYYRQNLGMDLFDWFLAFSADQPLKPTSPIQALAHRNLARHFHGLKRLLRGGEIESVKTFVSPAPQKAVAPDQLPKLRRQARDADNLHQALSLWQRITYTSDQTEDHLQLVETLFKLHEHNLAEAHLKHLAPKRQETMERLARFYREEENGRGLIDLHRDLYLRRKNRSSLAELAKVLAERGELRIAAAAAQIADVQEPVNPNPWLEARTRVTYFDAGTTLYNTETDRTYRAFRLNHKQHMSMQIEGPTRLRVQARPLHREDEPALDGGFSLKVNDGLVWTPYFQNRPSAAVTIKSGSQFQPGRPVFREITLGPGTHHVSLTADTHHLIVRFRERAPDQDQLTNLPWETRLYKALAEDQSLPRPESPGQAAAYLQAGMYQNQNANLLMIEAAALQANMPPYKPLAEIVDRLTENTHWRGLRTVDNNAGIRLLPDSGETVNDYLRTREALVTATGPGEVLIRGENRKTLRLESPGYTTAVLSVAVDGIPALPPDPVQVTVRLNRNKIKSFRVEPNAQWAHLNIPLSPGSHNLRIEVKEARNNQFLRVRLDPEMLRPETNTWFVATREQPVSLRFHQPTRLRVEQQVPGGIHVSYVTVTDTPARLEWKPEPGKRTALYRFARRVDRHTPDEPEPLQTVQKPEWLSLATSAFSRDNFEQQINHTPSPVTWSFETLARDRTLAEDEDGRTQHDRFNEGRVTWRGNLFQGNSRLRFQWRERESGGRTLALSGAQTLTTESGHRWQASASVNQQDADESLWSLYARLRWSKRYRLQGNLSHRSKAEIFGRHLSTEQAPADITGPVDIDVFSPYKADHPYGLRLGDELIWQPFADSWFNLEGRLDSNRDFTSLDRASLDIGWSQLMGPFQLSLATSARRYFADDHRRRDADFLRHYVDLSWSRQRRGARRWEARLRVMTDNKGKTDWTLSLNHIMGDIGNFQNYAPQEVLFRGLKTKRLTTEGGR